MNRRKLAVLIVVAVELILFAILLTNRVNYWNQAGWAGFSFHPWQAALTDDNPVVRFLGVIPGKVYAVAAWSPAQSAGIQLDDVVQTINDVPIDDAVGMYALNRKLGTGDVARYQILRDGSEHVLEVELISPFTLLPNVFALTESTLIGLAILAISLLVMWGRPRSLPAWLFFLMCAGGAVMMLGFAAFELHMPNYRGLTHAEQTIGVGAAYLVTVLISIFVANVMLHFVLVFPRERPVIRRIPKLDRWLHSLPFTPFVGGFAFFLVMIGLKAGAAWSAVAIASLVLISTISLAGISRQVRTHGFRIGLSRCPLLTNALFVAAIAFPAVATLRADEDGLFILGMIVGVATVACALLILLIYSVLTCIALGRSYREAGVEGKRQLRWPLWGTLLSMGATAALSIFGMIWAAISTNLEAQTFIIQYLIIAASKPLSLLIPASFAAAILKYRLMEIDVIIRKTVVFSIVTAIIAVGYLGVSGVLGFTLGRIIGSGNLLIPVFTALLFIAAFVPLLRWMQRLFERRFYRRKIDHDQTRARIENLAKTAPNFECLLLPFVEEIQSSLDCRTVSVFLDRNRKGRLQWEHSLGVPETRTAGVSLRTDDADIVSGATVIDSQKQAVGTELNGVLKSTRAVLAVTARTADEVVGMVTIGKRLDGELFEDEDGQFLHAIAESLATATERLRGRRAGAELSQAQEIQKALLPASIPQIPGLEVAATWRPAREVSGDYYDVIAFDDHRIGLCIGDVVGKGLPAALLMSSLQAAVRAVATAHTEPHEVCRQVRQVVSRNLTGGKFVTFFYALVDRRKETITASCAGHNPAILVSGDDTLVRLEKGGPAAARILSALNYSQESLHFGPGDVLVLFTDGVTEAMDSDGEMFGDERLEKLVVSSRHSASRDLVNRIVHETESHTHGQLQDDLTIVAARVSDL